MSRLRVGLEVGHLILMVYKVYIILVHTRINIKLAMQTYDLKKCGIAI